MENKIRKTLMGVVVSDKMARTVVVRVDVVKVHPKYHKRYTTSKKYPAHTETDDFKVGDKVVIEESRPYSKTVNWKVISKQ